MESSSKRSSCVRHLVRRLSVNGPRQVTSTDCWRRPLPSCFGTCWSRFVKPGHLVLMRTLRRYPLAAADTPRAAAAHESTRSTLHPTLRSGRCSVPVQDHQDRGKDWQVVKQGLLMAASSSMNRCLRQRPRPARVSGWTSPGASRRNDRFHTYEVGDATCLANYTHASGTWQPKKSPWRQSQTVRHHRALPHSHQSTSCC